MSKKLPQEDIDWLTNLEKEIREWVMNLKQGAYHGLNYYRSKRQLTKDEMDRIIRIVVDCELPISISLAQFGFSATIFDRPICVSTDNPQLFYFQSSQFPVERKTRHKEACDFLWPYVTTPRNLEMLKLYKLPLPISNDPAYYYNQ